jgi:hypothetical protein
VAELSAKAFSNFKNVSQMAIECRFMIREIIKDEVRWQKRE